MRVLSRTLPQAVIRWGNRQRIQWIWYRWSIQSPWENAVGKPSGKGAFNCSELKVGRVSSESVYWNTIWCGASCWGVLADNISLIWRNGDWRVSLRNQEWVWPGLTVSCVPFCADAMGTALDAAMVVIKDKVSMRWSIQNVCLWLVFTKLSHAFVFIAL